MRYSLVLAAVAACAEPSAPLAPARHDSVFGEILPRGNALIPLLDDAYADLEREMRPHGCMDCHAPEGGSYRARVRHAVMILDNRRVLERVLETNQMPPEDDDHAAGITDDVGRARLLYRVRVFRALGDAALATW